MASGELTQEELLQLELDVEKDLEDERFQRLLESDEYYQSVLSRIQNDSSLTNAQKQGQIEVLTASATDKLKQKQSIPVKDYDYFYGNIKDADGNTIKEPEGVGLSGRVKAFVGDAYNFLAPGEQELSESQIARDKADKEQAEYEAALKAEQDKYPTKEVPWWASSTFLKDMSQVPITMLPVAIAGYSLSPSEEPVYYEIDDNNEIKMTRIPRSDSNTLERIFQGGARKIITSIGGAVEREDDVLYVEGDDIPEGKKIGDVKEKGGLEVNITEESDLEKRIPELESGGFEGFLTDMIAFGVPAAKGFKTFKTVAGAGSKLKPAARAYLGGSLGASFAQALITTDGDQSLLVTGDQIRSILPNIEEETANDVAMVLDSLMIDGALDMALMGAMKAKGFLGRRGQGLRAAFDKEYLTNTIKEGTILNTITYLDPKLKDLGAKDFVQNVRQLAQILNNNAELHIKIGDTEGVVPVDTISALMKGAKSYVTVSNQKLKNSMGDKWDAFVNDEATALVQRMIDIQRAVPENVQSRLAQSNMLDGVQQVIKKAGDDITPSGITNQEMGQELVNIRTGELDSAAKNVDIAQKQVDTIAEQTDAVFAENPIIKQMLDGVDPKQLLDETTDLAVISKVFGEDGVNAYRQTWKEVEDAYKAIPNTPLDKTQLDMLRKQINQVITEIDPLRTQGKDNQKVAQILSEIRSVFKRSEVDVDVPTTSQFDSPEAAESYFSFLNDPKAPKDSTTRLQTADEVLADLEGTIGFQDLYKLKQKLEQLIQAEKGNFGVAEKLIELKKHITDKDGGQLGYMMNVADEATANAAINADKTFNVAMSKWMEGPLMKEYSGLLNERVRRGDNIPVYVGQETGQLQLDVQAQDIAKRVMADKTGKLFKQLELAMGSDVSKPIMDYYISQATRKLANALADTNTAAGRASYREVQESFTSIAQQLKNNNSPLYADLQKAINQIDATQKELGSNALAADKLLEQAKRQQDELENSVLDKFVAEFNQNKSTSTPQVEIGKLLKGRDAAGSLEALVKEIETIPAGPRRDLVLQSVKSSALKQLNERIFGSTPIGLVSPNTAVDNVKLANLAKITGEELDGTLSGLRILFKDEPFVIEGLETALKTLGDVNLPSRVKTTPAGAGSDTVPNLGIRDAVSGAILVTGGYMNPTSAAMRRASSNMVSAMETAAKNVGNDTLGIIISNPRAFANLAELIANKAEHSEIKKAVKLLLSSAGYAAKYDLRVQDEDEQTTGAFGSSAEAVQGSISELINGVTSLIKAF